MTPARLIKDLAAELKDATANLKFPEEYQKEVSAGDYVKVNVYEQMFPADLFESEDYYPFVSVELMTLKDNAERESRAEVGISFGVFAKEADGWLDLFYLMDVIRRRLLEKRFIGDYFRLTGGLEFELPDVQPVPFLVGSMQATYFIPHIHELDRKIFFS